MTRNSIIASLIVCAGYLSGPTAAAQSDGYEMEAITVFQYGESCSQLAQLSRVEIVGITHSAYAEQFQDFCKPDSVYRCEDYNASLAGLGSLEENGTSCRYLPL